MRLRSRTLSAASLPVVLLGCILVPLLSPRESKAQEVPQYAIQVMYEGKRALYFPLRREYLEGKALGFSARPDARSPQSDPRVSMILMTVTSDGVKWTTKLSTVKEVRLNDQR